MRAGEVEEKYLDVLQNIESSIISVYNKHPEMTDWNVEKVLDTLIRAYQDEQNGRAPLVPTFSELDNELYITVKAVCNWRVGRDVLMDDDGNEAGPEITPINLDEMVTCLKRLRLSLKRWNKQGGRRGYLDYIRRFLR